MKLVILHGSTKRQLEGSFRICASRADLETLAIQINNHICRNDGSGFSFGWITITADEPDLRPNVNVKAWDE